MSTAATRSIEQVANAAGDGTRWYQLYWPRNDNITLSILDRAKRNGFSVLVVTLDTIQLGFRPSDLDTGYLPFLQGVGCQVGFSDPTFMSDIGFEQHIGKRVEDIPEDDLLQMSIANLQEFNSGHYRSWSDLAFLRKHWEGPLVVKGIQSVQDAHHAIDARCDGIIV